MGFSRQEYWSGLAFPSPGDPPDPEIEPVSPVAPALAVGSLPMSHLGSPTFLEMQQKKKDWKHTKIASNPSVITGCESFLFYEMEAIIPTFQGCYND